MPEELKFHVTCDEITTYDRLLLQSELEESYVEDEDSWVNDVVNSWN